MPSPTQILGADAEARAEALLVAQDYEIIERNWRRRDAEIDRIAWHDSQLVFIEIRSRQAEHHGEPMETVDRAKQSRIVRGAAAYLQMLPVNELPCVRFDVVSVLDKSITLIQDAFEIDELGANRNLWML